MENNDEEQGENKSQCLQNFKFAVHKKKEEKFKFARATSNFHRPNKTMKPVPATVEA